LEKMIQELLFSCRAKALTQFVEAPTRLQITSPKDFDALRQGFSPPKCAGKNEMRLPYHRGHGKTARDK